MLGREPATVTEYEYDGDRLIGSRTFREPEWLDSDREAVIAVLELRRMIGPHGQPLDEAMSPDADPSSWDAKYRYVVKPKRDFAAKALSDAQEAYRKRYPDADLSSLRWRVEREDL